MALVVYDRVQETTATTGTGTITLGGAVAGYQSFAVVGNGNTTFYCIVNNSAWEVGIGTYSTSGPTLARTTVLSNSNGNTSPITLVGASNVFVTYPSEKSVNQDANGSVNILTNVPNTTTSIGTLNVGDGTYNFSQLGQLATFASNEPVVNAVVVQNTSTSNTAYSSIQLASDSYTSGYFLELGTNSSTYSYAAAGYLNSSINQPNTHYLLANKADLGIATWDADDIHFLQNASVATTDSMTLYASGGVSLGGNPDPGLGTLYANNVYLGFTTITAAAGTTVLTNASLAWQNVVGTTTQSIQMPVATTLYKGFAFTITNNSTGAVTIKDSASTTLDTVVTGGSAVMVLTANGTSAGTWVAYSYLPSSYDFSASTANFGGATITNALWNGTTISSGYGGTGLTTFSAANNAIYSTSSSALAAGTLPVAAGGTAATSFTSNGVIYGNGTSALGVTAAGTTGQVLIATTSGAPSWGSVPSTAAVTSFSAGTTGLTPSSATTGAVTLAGTLNVANGGTGQTSFTAGQIHYGSFSTSANLFWDSTNNRLGIGTNSPAAGLEVTTTTGLTLNSTATYSGITMRSAQTVGVYNGFIFSQSRGTLASPTATQSGDILGFVRANGWGATASGNGNAQITYFAEGTFTDSSQPTSIAFNTTPSASTTQVERLRITSAGGVSFGSSGTSYGSSGQILQSNGNAAPTWVTLGGSGVSEFAAGTALVFYQAAAPTGWTKSVANDNKALRVVSGATGGSAGGSVAFTTAFASQAVTGSVAATGSTTATGSVGTSGSTTVSGSVGGTTISTSQMPYHAHFVRGDYRGDSIGVKFGGNDSGASNMTPATDGINSGTYTGPLYGWYEGGSGSHNHGFSGDAHTHTGGTFTGTAHTHTSGAFTGNAINLAVQYIDTIVCTKN